MVEITLKEINEVRIIECRGIVERSDEKLLNSHCVSCLKDGFRAILFDWSRVTYFDSMGLEALLLVHHNADDYPGSRLGILITDPVMLNVYTTLRFDIIIPLYDDMQEAISALKAKASESINI